MKIYPTHTLLFEIVNLLEFIVSLFLLIIPKKKKWKDNIICFYGGFLFGSIPFFIIFENVLVVMIGCLFLSFVFLFLQKIRVCVSFVVVIFKMVLLINITLFAEQYSLNMLRFFLFTMFVTIIIFCIIYILYEIPLEKQICAINLFALLELSGAILQFYRVDFTYFEKDFFDSEESISLILYLLKVDFWVFDFQYLYIMIFFILLLVYWSCRKIIKCYKNRNR